MKNSKKSIKTHAWSFETGRLITEQWALDRIVKRAITLSEKRQFKNGPFVGRGIKR